MKRGERIGLLDEHEPRRCSRCLPAGQPPTPGRFVARNRGFEQRHIPLRMVIALPSLDGIKRAVDLKLGLALLPRRCAITEIASGRLAAIPVSGVSRRRQVMIVCRKAHRSHAAETFLDVAQEKNSENQPASPHR